MAKQIVKNTNRADKLVTKATNTFDVAIAKTEKANELLTNQVRDQLYNIASERSEIEIIQSNIQLREADIEFKRAKVKENDDLIEKLKQFTVSK